MRGNQMAKAVFLFSILSGGLLCLVSGILMRVRLPGNHTTTIILALVFAGAAVLFHFLAKKKRTALHVCAIFCNSIATGCAVGAFYQWGRDVISLEKIVLILTAYVVLSFVLYLLAPHCRSGRMLWFLTIVTFIALLVAVFWKWSPVSALVLFLGIELLAVWILNLCAQDQETRSFRSLSIGSFWLFWVILMLVLLFITEGDGLEGFFEGLFDGGGEVTSKSHEAGKTLKYRYRGK